MSHTDDTYTQGHHESVLRTHKWRTVENSAGYLLRQLRPGMRILDIGCGPGSISMGFAQRVQPGKVIGIDNAGAALTAARAGADQQNISNVSFQVGDAYDLSFSDDSFDVVHAHQVLQHLTDPVAALREMRRVCKPGGLVAIRDSDYDALTWYPANAGIEEWIRLYFAVATGNGGEPRAGRRLYSWAQAAGFENIQPSASAWCFALPEDRMWWSEVWAERITETALAEQILDRGLATPADLEAIAQACRYWGKQKDGWFSMPFGEIICTV